MAQHRMMSDWFETGLDDPEIAVRFLSQTGELYSTANFSGPVAVPAAGPRPRRYFVQVGAPWDEIDADDVVYAIGGPQRLTEVSEASA